MELLETEQLEMEQLEMEQLEMDKLQTNKLEIDQLDLEKSKFFDCLCENSGKVATLKLQKTKTRNKREKTNFYFPRCKFSCFSFNYVGCE
jgi:hypothetical protein